MIRSKNLLPCLFVCISIGYWGGGTPILFAQAVRQLSTSDGRTIYAKKASEQNDLPAQGPATEPLVDDQDQVVPLDPQKTVFLTCDRKSVLFPGQICLREGALEFFVCAKNSKEHESIISTTAKPSIIHAGLLATGVEPGKPVRFTPEFEAASGPKVKMTVRWQDAEGKRHEIDAKDWVQEVNTHGCLQTDWVFSGSLFQKLENGKIRYLADVTGEIIGVSNFSGVVLDLPIQSSSDNSELLFRACTEKIPPLETPVTVILTPELPIKKQETPKTH
ncbi:MAG: YdjY domain-containing protein [Planctomycetaceae bacterium]|nr:YdjY domain-containing protein [Planctomycetaceae bacterium]